MKLVRLAQTAVANASTVEDRSRARFLLNRRVIRNAFRDSGRLAQLFCLRGDLACAYNPPAVSDAIREYRRALKEDLFCEDAALKVSRLMLDDMITFRHDRGSGDVARFLRIAADIVKRRGGNPDFPPEFYYAARSEQARLEYHLRGFEPGDDFVGRYNRSIVSYEHAKEVIKHNPIERFGTAYLLYLIDCFDVGRIEEAYAILPLILVNYPLFRVPAELARNPEFHTAWETDRNRADLLCDTYWGAHPRIELLEFVRDAAAAALSQPNSGRRRGENALPVHLTPYGEVTMYFADQIAEERTEGGVAGELSASAAESDPGMGRLKQKYVEPGIFHPGAFGTGAIDREVISVRMKDGTELRFDKNSLQAVDPFTAQVLQRARRTPLAHGAPSAALSPTLAAEAVEYPGDDGTSRMVIWIEGGPDDRDAFRGNVIECRVIGDKGYDLYLPPSALQSGSVRAGMKREINEGDIRKIDGIPQLHLGIELKDLAKGFGEIYVKLEDNRGRLKSVVARPFEIAGLQGKPGTLRLSPLVLGHAGTAADSAVIASPAINTVPNPTGVTTSRGVLSFVISNLTPNAAGSVVYSTRIEATPLVRSTMQERQQRLPGAPGSTPSARTAEGDSLDLALRYLSEAAQPVEIRNRRPGGNLIAAVNFDFGDRFNNPSDRVGGRTFVLVKVTVMDEVAHRWASSSKVLELLPVESFRHLLAPYLAN